VKYSEPLTGIWRYLLCESIFLGEKKMLKPWKADNAVVAILEEVKKKYHPLLVDANVAVSFNASKPFIKDRFNWGKARKFSCQAKLWHDKEFDFEIILPTEGWHEVLSGEQREAWLDLHLTRFRPEMVVATAADAKGKMKPVKDKFGRISYTDEVKLDQETGLPIWKVDPLDLHVFSDNARKFGVWCDDFEDFKVAVNKVKPHGCGLVAQAECCFIPNID
jgi:hypothetical protein